MAAPAADRPTPLQLLADQVRGCVRCPLAAGRTQVVFGVGDPHADLMFVGEGPGREEDLAGEPFVGRSGKLLDQLMADELGIDRTGCYIANVVKCRPPNNRDPKPDEIAACRPYLEQQLQLIRPRVVVTLGNFATKLLLDTTEGIRRLRGHSYPFDLPAPAATPDDAGTGGTGTTAHLVPTYHPAAALRSGGTVLAEMRADFVRAKRLLGEPRR
ncbi:MAG TPA: uracil-DNA glycosylase [Acidimicrobiales bacterium]|nr:uracil-DNA glycosylase [Acidimicrobiales bacterium]